MCRRLARAEIALDLPSRNRWVSSTRLTKQAATCESDAGAEIGTGMMDSEAHSSSYKRLGEACRVTIWQFTGRSRESSSPALLPVVSTINTSLPELTSTS